MIDKILFDLDNVIIDSADWHYQGVNAALKELYSYEIPYDEHLKEYNGLPTRVKVAKLIKQGHLPKDANLVQINNLKQKLTIDIIQQQCRPDPEKLEIMYNLTLSGWTIGCVTNSIRLTAELMLEYSKLLQFMSVLICGDEVKQGKPNPESYILARNQLYAQPYSVIVIEDSPHGVKSATDAQCLVITVDNYKDVTWTNLAPKINAFNSNLRM